LCSTACTHLGQPVLIDKLVAAHKHVHVGQQALQRLHGAQVNFDHPAVLLVFKDGYLHALPVLRTQVPSVHACARVACMYACVHVYVCACICVCVSMRACMCLLHACLFVCVRACFLRVCFSVFCVCVYVCVCVTTSVQLCMLHAYTSCVYACVHA